MAATLLAIPADEPSFTDWIERWPQIAQAGWPFPRSYWLGVFETLLRQVYPEANSDSLTLTARHHAPFPLAAGKDVP